MIIESAAIIAAIIGVTQVAKTLEMPTKLAPLFALLCGLAAAFLVPAATIGMTIFSGIVYGLSASGLYSGTKATIIPPAGE